MKLVSENNFTNWTDPFEKTVGSIFKILFIYVLFQGCISIDAVEKSEVVGLSNLEVLNGTYRMESIQKYSESSGPNVKYSNFSQMIIRDTRSHGLNIDSIKNYSFELNAIDDNVMEVELIEKNNVIKTLIIKGKIKEDGYFYVQNRNFLAHNIPFIMGGYEYVKIRLGLNQDKNLIVDGVHESYGAFLFIFFGSITRVKFKYMFIKMAPCNNM